MSSPHIRPGHPSYERIREEVIAEQRAAAEGDSALERMITKINAMRERELETQLMPATDDREKNAKD